ncbi:MAG: BatA domain-containing protein, partial [Rhodobacterales bacterium]|nr:BatA domain-containing protein [Rhodobacterales bacterium]MDX5413225.1 BatA domain-containing protein [Rhodobacterales bacterium]
MMIGPIGFAAPWLLLGLLALPILWIILRAVPPAPIRRRFPGVALLLGLRDDDTVTDRTPWWLLLLRMLAVAAVIIGLAGPVLNPQQDRQPGSGPVLIVLDGGWPGAQDWTRRAEVIDQLLAEAGREGRTVAVMRLTTPEDVVFQSADLWRSRVAGLAPQPWTATPEMIARAVEHLPEGRFETLWFSDGLSMDGRDTLLSAVEARGALRVYASGRTPVALLPAVYQDGVLQLAARRAEDAGAQDLTIAAHGLDPSGTPRILATLPLRFESGETEALTEASLPAELRARITRFEIDGIRSAGAVALSDDSLSRREVALVAGRDDREGLELLSPLHYLRQALEPNADLLEGGLTDILPANPDVIILADVATLSPSEEEALMEWTEGGGLLLRFAGPRLAASEISRTEEHPLMPVRLRAGGRTVGGAMSWGDPKTLAPFSEDSPFFGLPIPDDVTVSAQVMAQPDPTLADRVIAQLTDGTPLVTRKPIGQGQVVLVHVTANAEWSSLPLSGLFVRMLDRLAVSSVGQGLDAGDMAGTTWQPVTVLDGAGRVQDAQTLPGVDGEDLVSAPLGPALRPGLYDGGDRRIARNTMSEDTVLEPASWPARIPVEGLSRPAETPLAGWLLAAALALLLADVIASLALS